MVHAKEVKDIMIGVFEFPHIPYWFSINQALRIAKVSFINSKKYPEPMMVLIFDEKYNLMGTLTLKDILKGLEPRLLESHRLSLMSGEEAERELSFIYDSLFTEESKMIAEKQVSDIMTPAQVFVEPNDPVMKAGYLMLSHDLLLLPVLENKKKLVGLVRIIEVFDEISNKILHE